MSEHKGSFKTMCGNQRSDTDFIFHSKMKKASEEAFLQKIDVELLFSLRSGITLRATVTGVGSRTATTTAVACCFFLTLTDLCLMLLMPYLELLHGLGFIEQSEGHTAKQVFQIEDAFVRENFAYGVRWLGTLVQPFE